MKKKIISVAMTILATGLTVAPALAADSADGLDTANEVAMVPVRLGGVAAGVVIGTPVAVVRESYKSYLDLTGAGAEQIHGKDNGPACLLVSVFTLPAGIVVGTVKGGYYGLKNGVMKGFSTPFNSESFCLGKLDE
jgi:hypothetical protein